MSKATNMVVPSESGGLVSTCHPAEPTHAGVNVQSLPTPIPSPSHTWEGSFIEGEWGAPPNPRHREPPHSPSEHLPGKSLALSPGLRIVLWSGGMALALLLMLLWGQTTSPHNDFAQNVWLPSRLLLDGADPYNPTRPQLDAALGPYSADFPNFNSGANFHFIYPVWVAVVLLPFGATPFPLALAVWRAGSLLLLVWACGALLRSTCGAFRALQPAALAAVGVTVFLSVAFKANVLNLYVGQFAAIELGLLVGVWAWLVRSGSLAGRKRLMGDIASGAALAVLAAKPQSACLAVAFLCLWAISRRRYGILISAVGTLAALLLLPLLFFPASLSEWLSILFKGGQAASQAEVSASVWGLSYNIVGAGSPWIAVSAALSLAGVALLLPLWRRDMKYTASAVPLSLPITVVVNSLISPYMLGYEHVLLLMPALVLLAWLGLPGAGEERGNKLLRWSVYAWLGVLPLLTGLLQEVSGRDYPIVVQSASLLIIIGCAQWQIRKAGHCVTMTRMPGQSGG